MSYPKDVALTYTAAASTTGLPGSTFAYTWEFDDAGSGVGTSIEHTWTTVGSHTATVTATDMITGGTGMAQKTVSIAVAPSSLLNTVVNSRAFATPSGDVFIAEGSSGSNYQYNKLKSDGTTSQISTAGYQDSASHNLGFGGTSCGDRGAAISQDGLWIAFLGFSTGSASAHILTVINTSTGTVQAFDMFTGVGASCNPSNGFTAMIISRTDNKFAVSTRSGSTADYTFIYNPVTNSAENLLVELTTSEKAYRGGIVLACDDGIAYCFNGILVTGIANLSRYDMNNHTWLSQLVVPSRNNYLNSTRLGCSAVKMADGRFLLIGGADYTVDFGGTYQSIRKVAIFTPGVTPSVTDVSDLNTGRYGALAVTLPDGRVLAAGGRSYTDSGTVYSSAEIYDPMANTWATLSSTMSQPRQFASAVVLPSGNVCILGGYNNSMVATNTIEYFHPADNKFYPVD